MAEGIMVTYKSMKMDESSTELTCTGILEMKFEGRCMILTVFTRDKSDSSNSDEKKRVLTTEKLYRIIQDECTDTMLVIERPGREDNHNRMEIHFPNKDEFEKHKVNMEKILRGKLRRKVTTEVTKVPKTDPQPQDPSSCSKNKTDRISTSSTLQEKIPSPPRSQNKQSSTTSTEVSQQSTSPPKDIPPIASSQNIPPPPQPSTNSPLPPPPPPSSQLQLSSDSSAANNSPSLLLKPPSNGSSAPPTSQPLPDTFPVPPTSQPLPDSSPGNNVSQPTPSKNSSSNAKPGNFLDEIRNFNKHQLKKGNLQTIQGNPPSSTSQNQTNSGQSSTTVVNPQQTTSGNTSASSKPSRGSPNASTVTAQEDTSCTQATAQHPGTPKPQDQPRENLKSSDSTSMNLSDQIKNFNKRKLKKIPQLEKTLPSSDSSVNAPSSQNQNQQIPPHPSPQNQTNLNQSNTVASNPQETILADNPALVPLPNAPDQLTITTPGSPPHIPSQVQRPSDTPKRSPEGQGSSGSSGSLGSSGNSGNSRNPQGSRSLEGPEGSRSLEGPENSGSPRIQKSQTSASEFRSLNQSQEVPRDLTDALRDAFGKLKKGNSDSTKEDNGEIQDFEDSETKIRPVT